MEWVVYRVSCDCIHDTDKLIGEGLPVAGKYRLLESYRVVMSGANQNSSANKMVPALETIKGILSCFIY